jgi:FlaA1/EpsC-like NDP-sugar epimerase
VLSFLSGAIAFLLRMGESPFGPPHLEAVLPAMLVFTAIAVPVFYLLRLHRGAWRYASLADLVTIIKAVTLAVVVFVPVMFVVNRLEDIPRSMPIIQWGVLIILLGGSRSLCRLLLDRRPGPVAESSWSAAPIPVLLLGTGHEAQLFLRAIETGHAPLYRVVGILDVRGDMVGRAIRGVPVLGQVEDLAAVLGQAARAGEPPQRLIVTNAAEQMAGAAKGELFERAQQYGLTLARLPRLTEFKDARDDDQLEIQPIALEDLLGRPQVSLDRAAISKLITGRRILITGAGGSIGSELSRQIAALGPAELVLADNSEFNLYNIDLELRERLGKGPRAALLCDVRDAARVHAIFARYRPEVVFHAAAFKHVPLVERNPCEGVLTNTIGTRNVAEAACTHRAMAMVLISTDKAVNPTSIMGASKRVAESYCQALDLVSRLPQASGTRFITVRFGNVLGSSGSVVPLFQRQIARGGPLTVTHPEIKRYFMTVREAIGLVLQASAHAQSTPDERGRIFVLDMGEPIRIVDIARQVIRLAGLEPDRDIRIEFTGLRPGEKLYEELFDATETPIATDTAGVLAAMPQPIELGRLQATLEKLADAARRQDVERLEYLLGELVRGFRQESAAA